MATSPIYPEDKTGLAVTNLVEREPHALTSVNSATHYIIVAQNSPIFANNKFKLIHRSMTGVETELVEGIDFYFCLPYVGASRYVTSLLFGGVELNRTELTGMLYVTYQTLGGKWTANRAKVLENLANAVYNRRLLTWDQVTDVQEIFPPSSHPQPMDTIGEYKDLVEAINNIAKTKSEGPQFATQEFVINLFSQLALRDHSHTIPSIIGLRAELDAISATIQSLMQDVAPGRPSLSVQSSNVVGITTDVSLASSTYISPNPHKSTEWQVSSDSGFFNIIYSDIVDTGDLTKITIPLNNETESTVYIRVRYIDEQNRTSEWSHPVSYTIPSLSYFEFEVTGTSVNFASFVGANVSVNWGDGTSNSYASTTTLSKTYATNETRTVKILFGKLTSLRFNPATKVTRILGLTANDLVSLNQAFAGLTSLTSVSMIDTTKVTDFGRMFDGCTALTTVARFSTTKGTLFNSMFKDCHALTAVPLFATENGTNFDSMLLNCRGLTTVPAINTIRGTTFVSMFQGCTGLTQVPLLNLASAQNLTSFVEGTNIVSFPLVNTEKCQNFSRMFANCGKLATTPVLNTAVGKNFTHMFLACSTITTSHHYDTSSGETFTGMFRSCYKLASVPLFLMSQAKDTSLMFGGCHALSAVPLFDLSNVLVASQMFDKCMALKSVPAFDLSKATNLESMFFDCSALETVPSLNTSSCVQFSGMFKNDRNLVSIGELDLSKGTDLLEMFYLCEMVTSIGATGYTREIDFSHLASLKTSDLVDLINRSGQAYQAPKIITLSLSQANNVYTDDVQAAVGRGWQFSNPLSTGGEFIFTTTDNILNIGVFSATNVSFSINGGAWQSRGNVSSLHDQIANNGNTATKTVRIKYTSLTALGQFGDGANGDDPTYLRTVTKLTNHSIKSMEGLFFNQQGLTAVSGIDVSKVTNAASMFQGCESLATVADLNFEEVTNAYRMFYNCGRLMAAHEWGERLKGFGKCTNVSDMFDSCWDMKSLPMLDLSKVKTISGFAKACAALTSVPAYTLTSVTYAAQMFSGCSVLVTVPNLIMPNCTNVDSMFENCTRLTTFGTLSFPLCTHFGGMFKYCATMRVAVLFYTSKGIEFHDMFKGCASLETVPQYNTSKGTRFDSMFEECFSLKEIPAIDLGNAATLGRFAHLCSKATAFKAQNYGVFLSLQTMGSLVSENGSRILSAINLAGTAKPESRPGQGIATDKPTIDLPIGYSFVGARELDVSGLITAANHPLGRGWQFTPPLPTFAWNVGYRQLASSTVSRTGAVIGSWRGRLYAYGGSSSSSAVSIYNIADNTWTHVNPQGPGVRTYPNGFMAGKYLYVWGGFRGGFAASNALSDMWRFDAEYNSWTRMSNGPAALGESGVAYNDSNYNHNDWNSPRGVVMFNSGWDGNNRVARRYTYGIETDTWWTHNSGNEHSANWSAGVYANNRFNFLGGTAGTSSTYESSDVSTWPNNNADVGRTMLANMPYGTTMATAFEVGGNIYVLGGSGAASKRLLGYHTATNTWRTITDKLPFESRLHSTTKGRDWNTNYVLPGWQYHLLSGTQLWATYINPTGL